MSTFERVLADGTVPQLLAQRAARSGDAAAYRVPAGDGGPPATIGWAAHLQTVAALAQGLADRGIGPGARVGILAATSVRWEAAQMAVLANGAVAVGLDPNYPDAELARLIGLTGLSALFVQDATTQRRVAAAGVPTVIRLDPGASADAAAPADAVVPTDTIAPAGAAVSFDALVRHGHAPGRALPVHARPDDAALMVFSSGTTGHPKPIVYTHRQVLQAVAALTAAFPVLDEHSRLLCWLPLANLFQRMINFCAIERGAASYVIDDPRTVMDHLPVAAPHLFIGVPRFFERVHAGIRARLDAARAPARALARGALAMSTQAARARLEGRRATPVSALGARAADALVLRRLRAAFGGHARYLLSGSAPMPRWLLEFYEAIGLPVYEAYGVSENIVPVAMNRPGARRLGTVGRPVEGNEVVIGADGEVRVRGPGVFSGYWHAGPDAPRPDADGFWSTGDLGAFDADGFLRLSGRKADVFKLSTGRWVAPAEVEERLRQLSRVDHAVVVGESRKAVVAIVAVEPDALPDGDAARERLAGQLARDVAGAVAGLSDYQHPAALLVVPGGFSIVAGDLTSNLKVRRRAIAQRFAADIEQVYRQLDRPRAGAAGPTPAVLFAASEQKAQ